MSSCCALVILQSKIIQFFTFFSLDEDELLTAVLSNGEIMVMDAAVTVVLLF